MPAYSAWVAASTRLVTKAPRFAALLRHFEIPLADMEAMLAGVDVDKQDADAVAGRWVSEHASLVNSWTVSG